MCGSDQHGSFSYVNYVMFVVRCLSGSILGWVLSLYDSKPKSIIIFIIFKICLLL
jgi:hypothetical protein